MTDESFKKTNIVDVFPEADRIHLEAPDAREKLKDYVRLLVDLRDQTVLAGSREDNPDFFKKIYSEARPGEDMRAYTFKYGPKGEEMIRKHFNPDKNRDGPGPGKSGAGRE